MSAAGGGHRLFLVVRDLKLDIRGGVLLMCFFDAYLLCLVHVDKVWVFICVLWWL
jgi:hypothetical protein